MMKSPCIAAVNSQNLWLFVETADTSSCRFVQMMSSPFHFNKPADLCSRSSNLTSSSSDWSTRYVGRLRVWQRFLTSSFGQKARNARAEVAQTGLRVESPPLVFHITSRAVSDAYLSGHIDVSVKGLQCIIANVKLQFFESDEQEVTSAALSGLRNKHTFNTHLGATTKPDGVRARYPLVCLRGTTSCSSSGDNMQQHG